MCKLYALFRVWWHLTCCLVSTEAVATRQETSCRSTAGVDTVAPRDICSVFCTCYFHLFIFQTGPYTYSKSTVWLSWSVVWSRTSFLLPEEHTNTDQWSHAAVTIVALCWHVCASLMSRSHTVWAAWQVYSVSEATNHQERLLHCKVPNALTILGVHGIFCLHFICRLAMKRKLR